MGRVPERYCARGKQCTQYPKLGQPSKLRISSENDTCESCLRARLDEDVEKANSQRRTSAKAKKDNRPRSEIRFREFKRGLVVQLFTQRGSFWDEVQRIRIDWEITPEVRIPPPIDVPEVVRIPPGTDSLHYPNTMPDQVDTKEWKLFRGLWIRQVQALRSKVLSEEQQYIGNFGDWLKFLSASLLYSPPDDDLESFAAYGEPSAIVADSDDRTSVTEASKTLRVSASPIRNLPDPYTTKEDAKWFYETAINDIGKRFLEPRGLDIWEMYNEVVKEVRESEYPQGTLGIEYAEKIESNEARSCIYVDSETTEQDVTEALRTIKETNKWRSKSGRSRRDELTAIQCAVYSCRYSWSYAKIADHYGWDSKDTAEEYVRYGRELLEE